MVLNDSSPHCSLAREVLFEHLPPKAKVEEEGCLTITGALRSREELLVLGGNIERLNEAQLVPDGKQVVALSAGLRNNCRISPSVFTSLLITWHYRLHSALSSPATKVYNLNSKKENIYTDTRPHKCTWMN